MTNYCQLGKVGKRTYAVSHNLMMTLSEQKRARVRYEKNISKYDRYM